MLLISTSINMKFLIRQDFSGFPVNPSFQANDIRSVTLRLNAFFALILDYCERVISHLIVDKVRYDNQNQQKHATL